MLWHETVCTASVRTMVVTGGAGCQLRIFARALWGASPARGLAGVAVELTYLCSCGVIPPLWSQTRWSVQRRNSWFPH